MARWEPNARLRLVQAAIDLFGEQGYDSTTVTQIAERAGLTKTTFFRHFPDKREVLFAGQEEHARLLTAGVEGAPATATPLAAVAAGLDALTSSFTPEQREFAPRLQSVVAGHAELRERSAFKRIALAAALTDALRRRGVPDPTASLAADLGVRAFTTAFTQWIAPANDQSFPALAHHCLTELHGAATALS
ncbi:TetR/AcrR family transcriptional regulator [Streptomyces shenzhenensis]|uniref:TetR/AcrR family transcriptional regulator n=1 Tax=Streptomyces shenzhenensis TaxID=943815 RepID=UPI0015F0C90E|nr:TetR/AcrR family transcriptional regulator [Streptomyces shenzhenensis]